MASAPGFRQKRRVSRIQIEPIRDLVEVKFAGRVVAQSTRALRLQEGKLPPRIYIPRDDVDPHALERTSLLTHCPHKGDAAYYSVRVDGQEATNGVWTYEEPIENVAAIREHLCFDDSKGIEIQVHVQRSA